MVVVIKSPHPSVIHPQTFATDYTLQSWHPGVRPSCAAPSAGRREGNSETRSGEKLLGNKGAGDHHCSSQQQNIQLGLKNKERGGTVVLEPAMSWCCPSKQRVALLSPRPHSKVPLTERSVSRRPTWGTWHLGSIAKPP